MPVPPLVDASELSAFPGSPFDQLLVDVAAESVRAEAGWHIAPEVTETIRVYSWGGTDLGIPSLRVVNVTAVRFGEVTYTDGWSLERAGLYRRVGWPTGWIDIELTHGLAETPKDLFPVIVSRIRNASNPRDPSVSQRSTTAGPFSQSETYRVDGPATDPTVMRYSVNIGVA